MGLKTFSIDDEIHAKFRDFCQENGMSMSKKIERFMKEETGEKIRENAERRKEDKKIDEHPLGKYC